MEIFPTSKWLSPSLATNVGFSQCTAVAHSRPWHPACRRPAPPPRTSCWVLGLCSVLRARLWPRLLCQRHVLNWTCLSQPLPGQKVGLLCLPSTFPQMLPAPSGPATVAKPASPVSSFLILRQPLPMWWHTGCQQPQPDIFHLATMAERSFLCPGVPASVLLFFGLIGPTQVTGPPTSA